MEHTSGHRQSELKNSYHKWTKSELDRIVFLHKRRYTASQMTQDLLLNHLTSKQIATKITYMKNKKKLLSVREISKDSDFEDFDNRSSEKSLVHFNSMLNSKNIFIFETS